MYAGSRDVPFPTFLPNAATKVHHEIEKTQQGVTIF